MHKKRRIKFVVIAIAAFALIMAVSGNAQHAAWTQGYLSGVVAAGGDSAAIAPALAHAGYGHHGFHGGFGIIGGIFKLGLFFLMFAFFAKMFGFMMWRLAGRTGGPPWMRGYGRHWAHRCSDSTEGNDSEEWGPETWRKKWHKHHEGSTASSSGTADDDENRPDSERFVV